MRVEMGNLRNLKIVWVVFALVVVLASCAAPPKVGLRIQSFRLSQPRRCWWLAQPRRRI